MAFKFEINTMKKSEKIIVIILVILNFVVLLGQLIPEGVPPFAQTVNIVFLTGILLFFYI